MAILKRTPDKAAGRSKPNSGAHPDLQCSYDLRGRLLEINEPLERVLGYSRQEILGANLSEFLDPNSWELTRQTILEQAGGAACEPRNIRIRRKSGELCMLEVATRLVFDKGTPVAVDAVGRDLTPPDARELRETQALLSSTTTELNRFTGLLKELHRLSTTKYSSLDEVFADFLKTGRAILGLNYGAVVVHHGEFAVVGAVHGDSSFLRAGTKFPLSYLDRSCEFEAAHSDLQSRVSTPIFAGTDLYGTLLFSGIGVQRNHAFTNQDQEIIELMSRNLGPFILEDRRVKEDGQAPRNSGDRSATTRNRVVEPLAADLPLTGTLSELGRLIEHQSDGWKCFFLLAEDGAWATVPGSSLPVEFLSQVRQECLHFSAPGPDLGVPMFSTASFEFAKALGLAFSAAYPILSGTALVGALLLMQPHPMAGKPPDAELVMLSVRMAGIALEQKSMAERLAHHSQHDTLTGLVNRFRLLQILDQQVANSGARAKTVAVLFIGLDRFKQINDTLGHGAGDELLMEVATRLRSCLGSGDSAARMGGDEFAVVLSNPASEAEAIEASSRFLEILRAPYRIAGRELFVTASIGISFYPGNGDSSAALLRSADLAMHQAKNKGTNAIECFVPYGHKGGVERLELENALRRALEKSEFDLNFQSIVSIDGELDGFEVLLGWNHPALGRISPARFIPIAEKTGLIIPIGQWVLEQACCQAARWIKTGLTLKVLSVNVSALQFSKPDFVRKVAKVLESTGFPARLLELELTEGFVLHDVEESIGRMSELREIGVGITIDDFGTGYSSLNYLRRLPVAGLKIDQSFLRDLHSNSSALKMVETIVSLAHTMNLSVVAEGVETLHELELVRAAGCDRVQGHLYGMALNAAAAGVLLAQPGRRLRRSPAS
jgi:diguanylate cyclase (GGDEF)-like protein/PAS domain S-box-containing protein